MSWVFAEQEKAGTFESCAHVFGNTLVGLARVVVPEPRSLMLDRG